MYKLCLFAVCSGKFKTKNDMQRHREKHFRPERPIPIGSRAMGKEPEEGGDFKCQTCGKAYKVSTVFCLAPLWRIITIGDEVLVAV